MGLSKCALEMLQEMGIKSIDDLFADLPREIRTEGLRLPEGLSELDLTRELQRMLSVNLTADKGPSFLGAGVYNHFIPSAVSAIMGRSEFVTSYTPYQPEISQGMLQALFEYQSYMAELTAMDVVNSSMYDASTALGEALLMSHRISGGDTFLVSRAVSPERKAVARLYAMGAGIEVKEVGYDPSTGAVDLADLEAKLTPDVSGFYCESPNFFGVVEPRWKDIRAALGSKTMVMGTNPMSLALLKPPGELGADIAIGDAQVFGIPMSLGGPTVGVFACRTEHVRKMPGRIIGMTKDMDGRMSFCMTLQTREQHIRRSKATSNICTNEALMALGVAAYLAVIGRNGLRHIASKNVGNMRALSSRIARISGFRAPHFEGTHFNEFVVTSEVDQGRINRHLLEKGIQGGLCLSQHFPELRNAALYTTTEMHTDADHERLCAALEDLE